MSRRNVDLPLVAVVLMSVSGCFAEMRAARIDRERRIESARSATYRLPRKQVWSALYSLVAEGYQITRESESRGYLETEWRQDDADRKSKVEAETVGEDIIRVVIRVHTQTRSRSSRFDPQTFETIYGPWSDWSAAEPWTERKNELYVKLWKSLGGKLEESAVEALKIQK